MEAKDWRSAGGRGFTLIEMVLVLAIVAILVAAGITQLSGIGITAKYERAKADIQTLKAAVLAYEVANLTPPTTEQGLAALVDRPDPSPKRWRRLMQQIPRDPWGNDYVYQRPGPRSETAFDLRCLGADGVESEDDVGNWPDE